MAKLALDQAGFTPYRAVQHPVLKDHHLSFTTLGVMLLIAFATMMMDVNVIVKKVWKKKRNAKRLMPQNGTCIRLSRGH